MKGNGKLDKFLDEKRKNSLMIIGFLSAIKENLPSELAFKVACEAFSKYMIRLYTNVLATTEKGSQERFDKFRVYYEEYAQNTPYLEIIESNSRTLRVKYNRCPFYEILKENDLEDLAYAFCLSDPAFTEKVLPGVRFTRSQEIAMKGTYCDNTWEFFAQNK